MAGKLIHVLMVATCDESIQCWVSSSWAMSAPEQRVQRADTLPGVRAASQHVLQMQINADNLKDRERWAQGWLQREELDSISTGGPECRRCSGTGRCACHFCAMPGRLIPV